MKLEILTHVGGVSVYVNDTRITGSKPWGGGSTVVLTTFKPADMLSAMGNRYKALQESDENWLAFCRALDEGRIAVVLEGASDSIDGGVIVTDIDEVLEHIKEFKI